MFTSIFMSEMLWFEKYNPNSKKVWMLCKRWIKTEHNELQILLTTIQWNTVQRQHELYCFVNNTLTLNLMHAIHVKKGWDRATKDGGSCWMVKKHLFGAFHRSIGNRSCNLDEAWTGILERLSCSQALTGRGSYRFWSDTCCHPDDVFFRHVPAFFPVRQQPL